MHEYQVVLYTPYAVGRYISYHKQVHVANTAVCTNKLIAAVAAGDKAAHGFRDSSAFLPDFALFSDNPTYHMHVYTSLTHYSYR